MRYALITGTSRGIGKALALRYLDLGYTVLGIARHSTIVHANYRHFELDLGATFSTDLICNSMIDPTELVVIHNAGILGEVGRFSEHKQRDYQQVFQVNVFAGIQLVGAILDTLPTSLPLKVAFVSSGAGRRSIPSWSAYCASKAAVDRWLAVVAEEEKELGHVNRSFFSIAPGVVDTEMQESIRSVDPKDFSSSIRFHALKLNAELSVPQHVAQDIQELLATSELSEVITSLSKS